MQRLINTFYSHQNITSNDVPYEQRFSAKFMVYMLSLLLIWQPIMVSAADIIADVNAPKNQQATVLNTSNGLLLVNIRTPSTAGVSRNAYSTLNVPKKGAVFNNSHANVQTQLGGWVQGNPWLSRGSARIILNEVNSSLPSLLQGHMEVAGQRAQMVVVNPSGINCDGCGFINSSRSTLTTGTPILSGGALQGYRVQKGTITIQGNGLDASQADYTDLIARAVQVNAGIWANDLKITAGANNVDAANTTVTAIAASTAPPEFAVDVSNLGGMYAGKIHLIGTEAGVGVRNAGAIGATAGGFTLRADGRLENTGSINSSGSTQITLSDSLTNTGTLYTQTDFSLNTKGNIINSGVIAAKGNATLVADGANSLVNSTATSVLAAGLNSDGTLAVPSSSAADLIIHASRSLTARGQNLAATEQRLTAQTIDISNSQTVGDKLQIIASQGDINASHAEVFATDTLHAETMQSLITDDATISALQLNLAAHDLSNVAGKIIQTGMTDLSLDVVGDVDNSVTGLIQTAGGFSLSANRLDNQSGKITAGNALTVSISRDINNISGTIASNDALSVKAAEINNISGTLASVQADAALTATAGDIDNTSGKIISGQTLTTSSLGFNNTKGRIITTGDLDMQSGILLNDAGLIQSGNKLTINTHGQTLTNSNSGISKGILAAGTALLTTGNLNNQTGYIGTKGSLTVNSTDIHNTKGVMTSAAAISLDSTSLNNKTGRIEALGDLSVNAEAEIDNQSGLLRSRQTLALTATNIDNRNTQVSAQSIEGHAQGIEGHNAVLVAQDINNSLGEIRADNLLKITSSGILNNSQGLISSRGAVTIADSQADTNSNVAAKTLDIINTGGTLIADRDLNIDSMSLTGDGRALSRGDLTTKLIRDYIHTGEWQADGNGVFTTTGILINQAKLLAGDALNVVAVTIDNQAGAELTGRALDLTATDSLINRGLINGQDTFIDSITLNNIGTGRIYGDHIAIAATTLFNQDETVNGVSNAAVIAARDRLDIGATTITNSEHAILFSAGDLAIGGSLDVNHQAINRAATLTNTGGTIESLGDLTANIDLLQNLNADLATQQVAGPSVTETKVQQRDHPTPLYPLLACSGIFGRQDKNSCVDGNRVVTFEDYSVLEATATSWRTEILRTSPGIIRAGGNIVLNGNVTNHDSSIVAGATGSVTGATINNIATAATDETKFTDGTARFTQVVSSGWSGHKRIWDSAQPWKPASIPGAYRALDTLNTAISGSGVSVSAFSTSNVNQAAIGSNTATSAVRAGDPSQTRVVARATALDASATTKTISPNINLPDNSLFRTNPNLANNYLIETDPIFASYRDWLSSDYILNALAYDPATTIKRLGDGFYEQRLIREQVAQLTGRRFLAGYANDETQYKALMNNSVTIAKAFNLTPGIALSSVQVAQLTSDIVWLVQQTVTLADGSTAQVLVPQVYIRTKEGDLKSDGALISADSLNVVSGDFTNRGTVAGREILTINADNINNLEGRFTANEIELNASNDLNNLGGQIDAINRIAATAGHDINVVSSTQTTNTGNPNDPNATWSTRTSLTRVAGLYVTDDQGVLNISSGNDTNLIAAQVSNNGQGSITQFSAGHDLNLNVVTTAEQNNIVWNSKNHLKQGSSEDVGTQIRSNGDITFIAGHDMNAKAATITSGDGTAVNPGGQLKIITVNDINVSEGQQSQNWDEAHQTNKKSFFSRKTTTTRNTANSTQAIASQFSADSISLQAGYTANANGTVSANKTAQTGNIKVQGSNIVAEQDVNMNATGNINIEAAQNSHEETHFEDVKRSGLMSSGGIGFTIGKRQLATTNKAQNVTNVGSTIGSVNGDVNITAGKSYTQTGSAILTPASDINITAQQVDINSALDTSNEQHTSKFSQSGVTLSFSNAVISAAQTVQQMSKASRQTEDPRMDALAAGTAALALKNASDAVAAGQGTTIDDKEGQIASVDAQGNPSSRDANMADKIGGINISLSVGSSKSESTATQSSSTVASSSVIAGGDINISATGAQQDSDLNIIGSTITAQENVHLTADDEIKLQSAQNTASLNSDNKSISGSIGVGIALGGANKGFAINLGLSGGLGDTSGDDVVHTNTVVKAGNTVHSESGTNTQLKGASIKGERVILDVGTSGQGSLNIASQQDQHNYDSEQINAGIGATLCIPPFCEGASSVNVSVGASDIKSDYASVNEQSGIMAGDGGFQVNVAGNTNLTGGVIGSTEQAIQANANSLTTQTITTSDIDNTATYAAKSISVSLGSNTQDGRVALSGAGMAKDEGTASTTTASGISAANIKITDQAKQQSLTETSAAETIALIKQDIVVNKNGDIVDSQGNSTANTIAPIFDAKKVAQEIQAQTNITQAFSQQSSVAINNYTQTQMNALRKQYAATEDEEEQKELQARVDRLRLETHVMNVLIGAVTGKGGTALLRETLAAAAEEMRKLSIADSKIFAGVTDSDGTTIDNTSGESIGGKWDLSPVKVGGTRADLDALCGKSNERCVVKRDENKKAVLDANGKTQLLLDAKNRVQWDAKAAEMSLHEFINSPDGQKMAGTTGGIQGYKGSLFGIPYKVGSLQDYLIEAFAGTHDHIGGKKSGLYNTQGNAARDRAKMVTTAHNVWSGVAIVPSIPFAMATLLHAEVWQGISILLGAAIYWE